MTRLRRDFELNRYAYFMVVPVVLFYGIFHYGPMYGAIIAFKDFSPGRGIWGSVWVGFDHFKVFFQSDYFFRVIRNTLLINLYGLLFTFPVPILFALLLNELRSARLKRVVQTISYLPHFLSTMIVCGIIHDFTSRSGLIGGVMEAFGVKPDNLLNQPSLFRGIYIISDIWQHTGWSTILYIAALAAIDLEQYDAAKIDGASRFQQIRYITLPGIMPVVVTLLLLKIGQMMSLGFEKIILLYNPLTYETADVISSFVYRKGLLEFSYGYSTAVGLFNSTINFTLIVAANRLSRSINETSLW